MAKQNLMFHQKLIISLIMVIFLPMSSYANNNGDEKSNIRSVVISGVKLNIPRNFLVGSSATKSNGADESLLLAFTYPAMTGGMGDGHDSVLVFCEDKREYLSNMGKTHEEYLNDGYWDEFFDIDQEEDVYKIKFQNFDQDLKRKHYIVEDYGSEHNIEEAIKGRCEVRELSEEEKNSLRKALTKLNEKFKKRLSGEIKPHLKHLYTNDNPENPKEFIVCDTRSKNFRSFCESSFFDQDLYIQVTINRKYLSNYDDIKEQILKLITQWKQI